MSFTEDPFNATAALFLFVLGASIGSFLEHLACVLPHEELRLGLRTACPHCEGALPRMALVPIWGFFAMKRRCPHCRNPLSPRRPLVEGIAGLLTVLTFLHFFSPVEAFLASGGAGGRWWSLASALWLLHTGIVLTLIDLEHGILPDLILIPGAFVSLALGFLNPSVGWAASLGGLALGAGSLYFTAKVYEALRHREGLGFGDVKYLGFLGAVLGWQSVPWVLALASLLGALVGLGLIFARRGSLSTALPFGPYLAVASFILSLWGDAIRGLLVGPTF